VSVSLTELGLLITAIATLVSSCAGLVVALRTSGRVAAVKTLVNGQSETLNTLTAATSFAAGVEHGRYGVSPPQGDPSNRLPPAGASPV